MARCSEPSSHMGPILRLPRWYNRGAFLRGALWRSTSPAYSPNPTTSSLLCLTLCCNSCAFKFRTQIKREGACWFPPPVHRTEAASSYRLRVHVVVQCTRWWVCYGARGQAVKGGRGAGGQRHVVVGCNCRCFQVDLKSVAPCPLLCHSPVSPHAAPRSCLRDLVNSFHQWCWLERSRWHPASQQTTGAS